MVVSDVGQVGLLCVAGQSCLYCFILFSAQYSTYYIFTVYWHNTSGSICSPLCCFVAQSKLKAVEPAKEQQGEKKQTRWVM